MTKTVDGICADCWGSKGGRKMGWKKTRPGAGAGSGGSWWLGGALPPVGCFTVAALVVALASAVASWVLA